MVDDVEEGYADIASQKSVAAAVGQNMVYQRRRGAFAFGAGHANYLLVVAIQKQFGLRSDALGLDKIVDMVES